MTGDTKYGPNLAAQGILWLATAPSSRCKAGTTAFSPDNAVVATAHSPLESWEVQGCYNIRGGGRRGTWPLVRCKWHEQAYRWHCAPKCRCSQCLLCRTYLCFRLINPLQLLEAGRPLPV